MQPYVSQLSLYDIANVAGVAADLSHCNTAVQVQGDGGGGDPGAPSAARSPANPSTPL
jgi:malate dehydrogenase